MYHILSDQVQTSVVVDMYVLVTSRGLIFSVEMNVVNQYDMEHLVPLPLLDIIICPYLGYYILSIFHNLGSPRNYHTLIFDLMSSRNMYLYNAYIYTYILFYNDAK